MIDVSTLMALGFDRNPLAGMHQTADQTRINHAVRMAVNDKSLLVVSGRRGMGKTTAVSRAIQAIAKEGGNLAIIQPNRVEVEQLRTSDLLVSTILDLSEESPRQHREARIRQVSRILGTTKKSVVMVIEEAHRLSYPILLALKRLREISHFGVFPLLSIILVGQRNPLLHSRGLDEVRLRSMAVDMQGLTAQEATQIIQTTMGKAFDEDAIHAAAHATPVWLDMQNILANAMTRAATMARQNVTVEDVRIAAQEVDPGSPMDCSDLRVIAKKLNMGGDTLSKLSGVSRSQTYAALAGGKDVSPAIRNQLADTLEAELKKVKAA